MLVSDALVCLFMLELHAYLGLVELVVPHALSERHLGIKGCEIRAKVGHPKFSDGTVCFLDPKIFWFVFIEIYC